MEPKTEHAGGVDTGQGGNVAEKEDFSVPGSGKIEDPDLCRDMMNSVYRPTQETPQTNQNSPLSNLKNSQNPEKAFEKDAEKENSPAPALGTVSIQGAQGIQGVETSEHV